MTGSEHNPTALFVLSNGLVQLRPRLDLIDCVPGDSQAGYRRFRARVLRSIYSVDPRLTQKRIKERALSFLAG